jgi:uncharacterized spore protein YtfJ
LAATVVKEEQMGAEDVFQQVRSVIERIGVKSIYGEPVSAGEKTVIPVAKVRYGFGGGFGKSETDRAGQGGGGGGGFIGSPAGFIEITPEGSHFVVIGEYRKIAAALLVGVALGLLAGKVRRWRGILKR